MPSSAAFCNYSVMFLLIEEQAAASQMQDFSSMNCI